MAKTNYTKVEEALAEGLRQLTRTKLLELADLAKAAGNQSKSAEAEVVISQHHLLSSLQRDLKELYRHGPDIYTQLGIKKKEMKKFIEHPDTLTPQDWERLKQVKAHVDEFKKEIVKNLPQISNESIVEQERVKHVTKRFNIRDKWIPLK